MLRDGGLMPLKPQGGPRLAILASLPHGAPAIVDEGHEAVSRIKDELHALEQQLMIDDEDD